MRHTLCRGARHEESNLEPRQRVLPGRTTIGRNRAVPVPGRTTLGSAQALHEDLAPAASTTCERSHP